MCCKALAQVLQLLPFVVAALGMSNLPVVLRTQAAGFFDGGVMRSHSLVALHRGLVGCCLWC